jgi:hypothetical protein
MLHPARYLAFTGYVLGYGGLSAVSRIKLAAHIAHIIETAANYVDPSTMTKPSQICMRSSFFPVR